MYLCPAFCPSVNQSFFLLWKKTNHLFPPCQVSILGDPPKDVNLPQGAFLNVNNVFPSGEMLFFFFCSFFFFFFHLAVCSFVLRQPRYSGKCIPACNVCLPSPIQEAAVDLTPTGGGQRLVMCPTSTYIRAYSQITTCATRIPTAQNILHYTR